LEEYHECYFNTYSHYRKKSVGWSITLSVLMIVAGILGILLPPVAGMVATVFFGWLLVSCGIAHLVVAWHTRAAGTLVWELLIGTRRKGV
jgi:uncharacterized membrane protein HdeD (DUF308 family)